MSANFDKKFSHFTKFRIMTQVVWVQNRFVTLLKSDPDGSCMFQSLKHQLGRFRPEVDTDKDARFRLRQQIVDRLERRIENDDVLQELMSSQRADRGQHRDDWSTKENAVAELKQLRLYDEWGGPECCEEFAAMHGVKILVLTPTVSHEFGEPRSAEQLVIYFNG